MAKELFIGTDHNLKVEPVDEAGSAITGATVEFTVKDSGFSNVSGETWPASLTETSSGIYEGNISDSLSLEQNRIYYIELTVTKGSTKATWRDRRTARYLTF